MFETNFTLTRGDDDIDLTIEYEKSPYDPGCMWGPPEHCYPPEGGEVEEIVVLRDGEPFDATDAELQKIEAHLYELQEDEW